jgi:thiol-disulfide isomerase/thioredoxin
MRGKIVRAAILVGITAIGCAVTQSTCNVHVGQPAPVIEGADTDGQVFRLSDYSGRVVMISFWGNFCGPCRALFPHERGLVEKYQDKPFVLLGVNGDADVQEPRSAQIAKRVTWRSWWDGPAGAICHQYCVEGFPTVILIDHTGIIRYRSDGAPNPHELDVQIEKLIHDVPTPVAKLK